MIFMRDNVRLDVEMPEWEIVILVVWRSNAFFTEHRSRPFRDFRVHFCFHRVGIIAITVVARMCWSFDAVKHDLMHCLSVVIEFVTQSDEMQIFCRFKKIFVFLFISFSFFNLFFWVSTRIQMCVCSFPFRMIIQTLFRIFLKFSQFSQSRRLFLFLFIVALFCFSRLSLNWISVAFTYRASPLVVVFV